MFGVREMHVSQYNGGMWGGESRSQRHVRERLLYSTADRLGFVRFRQLPGACARDFCVRLLTARQRGPPALFHKFLLPP